jgi:hypothetical protein
MAATFRFSTTPMFSGTTIRIYNTSTNWAEYVPANSTTVTLTLTATDGGAVFIGGLTSFVKTYATTDLVGDFILDLLAAEVFANAPTIIPDDIIKFKIDITGSTAYQYVTDEVFYYNSWMVKSEAAYNAVDFIEDINCREIKYACMVNALYQGLTADIFVGNTSGIYEKIDIFTRLALQQ